MNAYSFLRLTSGNVSYGNLPSALNGSQSFSISAWIRVNGGLNDKLLFATAGSVLLGVRTQPGVATYLFSSMAGMTPAVVTSLPLPNDPWMLVTMVYDTSPESGPTVNFYINGIPSGGSTVTQPSMGPDPCFTSGQGVDVGVVILWSVALLPSQCLDIYQEPSASLIASYVFLNGLGSDQSPNHAPITFPSGASQYWAASSLQLAAPAAMALLPAETAVNPGSRGAAFSLCGWVNVGSPTQSAVMTIYSNGATNNLTALSGLLISVSYQAQSSGQCTLAVHYGTASANISLQGNTSFNAGEWHWFGVSFDGTTLTLYLDGSPDGTQTLSTAPPALAGPQVLGASTDANGQNAGSYFLGSMQAIAIFNSALGSALANYMRSNPIAPTGQSSCVAYYSFEVGNPINDVSGAAVALSGMALVEEYLTAITSSPQPDSIRLARSVSGMRPEGQAQAIAVKESRAAGKNHQEGYFNLHALAAELPAPSTRPKSSALSDQDIDQLLTGFESVLNNCPTESRAAYRQQFRDNLYRGLHLQNIHADPRIGLVSYAKTEGHYVFYHHLPGGKRELERIPIGAVPSDCTIWQVACWTNLFLIILSAFGLAVTGSTLKAIFSGIVANATVSGRLIVALLRPLNLEGIAFWFVFAVQAFYSAGQIPELARSVFSGMSWWSFAFAVTSLVVNIVAMIGSGGAYLAMFMTQLGLSIAQFIVTWRDKPLDCNPPVVSLSSTSLSFGPVAVGSQSSPQGVNLVNIGATNLNLTNVAASGDFTVNNACASPIAPNSQCELSVIFAPTATGTRTGAITLTDDAPDSPQSISLTGVGTQPN